MGWFGPSRPLFGAGQFDILAVFDYFQPSKDPPGPPQCFGSSFMTSIDHILLVDHSLYWFGTCLESFERSNLMFEKVSGFEIGKYGHQATYWLDFSISKALTFSNMRFDLSNDPRHVPNQYKTWSYDRIGSYEVIKVDPNLWGCPRGPLEGRKSSKMTKIMDWPAPKSGREAPKHSKSSLKLI